MEDYKLNILRLCKVCWTYFEKFSSQDKAILFWERHDGMPIILDNSASKALTQQTQISEHLMTARFVTSHAKVTIIQCCMPPTDHEEVVKDKYFQELQDLVSHVSHYDITTVMGNMNAHIGRDRSGFGQVLGPHAYGMCRDNGNCLINFLAMINLKIGSSIFQYKDIHKIT